MFSLVSTLLLPRLLTAQWTEADVGSQLLSKLFSENRRIVVTIQPNYQTDVLYVDLEQFRAEYAYFNNTLSLFIASLTSLSFSTIAELPNKKVGYVKYSNAYYSNYQVELKKFGVNYPPNTPDDLKPDLAIYRKNYAADNIRVHTDCLVSVNGYFHMTTADDEMSYIIDGGRSVRHAHYNAVGLHSFQNAAKIEKLSILPGMVSVPDGFTALKERVLITLPDNKTIKNFMLVLGGYIVFPDDPAIQLLNDKQFTVNLNFIRLIERYYESSLYLDLSGLGLTPAANNTTGINIDELYSDIVLKKYFTLSQSFIVLIDSDNFFHSRISIRHAKTPGLFNHLSEPRYPLFLGTGRVAEYWKKEESKRWMLSVQDGNRRNPMFYYQFPPKPINTIDQLSFMTPFYFSEAYMIEMGVYQNVE